MSFQLAQSDSLHCHANLGREAAKSPFSAAAHTYLAWKQTWNCSVNQAVVLLNLEANGRKQTLLTVWTRWSGLPVSQVEVFPCELRMASRNICLAWKLFGLRSSKNNFQHNTAKIPNFFHLGKSNQQGSMEKYHHKVQENLSQRIQYARKRGET